MAIVNPSNAVLLQITVNRPCLFQLTVNLSPNFMQEAQTLSLAGFITDVLYPANKSFYCYYKIAHFLNFKF